MLGTGPAADPIPMDTLLTRHHRLVNAFQTLLLLGGMLLILATLGHLFAGGPGMLTTLILGLFLLLLGPRVSPRLVLRLYGARRLTPFEAPGLQAMVQTLARRAGLGRCPVLYYLPSRVMNAFTVGGREDAAIAVSDGLLRAMSPRELAGVLAHEVSHLRHNDLWVMGLADLVSRLTSALSFLGLILVLVNLPLILFTETGISWPAILLLVFAPSLTALLQLALSRTREYDADLGAVMLTGDPQGLASALAKLEYYSGGLVGRILLPGRRLPEPSLLRTHPPTRDRIERLRALTPTHPPLSAQGWGAIGGPAWPPVERPPRHRLWWGLWH